MLTELVLFRRFSSRLRLIAESGNGVGLIRYRGATYKHSALLYKSWRRRRYEIEIFFLT